MSSSTNSGILTGASGASPVDAILAYTGQVNGPITIENVASVAATSTFQNAYGIAAFTAIGSTGSPVSVENSGDITANSTTGAGDGIVVQTNGDASPVSIVNSADINATGLTFSNGILGSSAGINSPVSIVNSGDIVSTTTSPVAIFAFGIEAFTSLAGSPITIDNSGALTVSGAGARGIDVRNLNTDNPIVITSTGNMTVTATAGDAFGIYQPTRIASAG
jgi:hypothetical protein